MTASLLSTDDIAARATDILARLVAFDTTSRGSNLDLIGYVEAMLATHGVASHRVMNDDATKANLYATVGPAIPGGIVLSGHTDVVPVDGQAWSSDPFVLTRRGDRLFGRGTCDMKGFIALALAVVPDILARGPARPVHLALSYDEEVGCLGAPAMIRELVRDLPPPRAVIVGEPTDMAVVCGHKGIASWTVTVTGHEAHSSLTHLGISANMIAVRLMQRLADLAETLEREADPQSPFEPRHATLTIGLVQGGTAVNILARSCSFTFDLRAPPGQCPNAIIAPFLHHVAEADAATKTRFPAAGVTITQRSSTPGFLVAGDSQAAQLVRSLTGDNAPDRVVSYAAEAGQFQDAGFSTVICGPGSIEQAHQPDEYLECDQLARGAAFMARLAVEVG